MNIDALLTAHSADDQAETVWMRLARGPGVRGLSGMGQETKIAAGAGSVIRLRRPLLKFSRTRLTETVSAYQQPFIDDPSNQDISFERVRVRSQLADLESRGILTKSALTAVAGKMRNARSVLERRERALFEALAGEFTQWGGALVSEDALHAALDDPALGAMAATLLQAITGADYRPDESAALTALTDALENGAATLAGAIVKKNKDSLFFLREPAAVLGRDSVKPLAPVIAAPGQRVLFDRRLIVKNCSRTPVTIAPASDFARGDFEAVFGPFEGPAEALSTMPKFEGEGGEFLGLGPFAVDPSSSVIKVETLARDSFFKGLVARF